LGSSDKEGLTTFALDGTHLVRRHVGDWDEHQVFANDGEMLTDLRAYYDWDTKRATQPHRPAGGGDGLSGESCGEGIPRTQD
jgi:hypothetical protein